MAVLPVLRVLRSEAVAARMQRVVLGGAALRSLAPPTPAQHVRLLFGEPGRPIALPTAGPTGLVWPADPALRPAARSMTVHRHDPRAGEIAIDVALHGATAGTRWATGAQPGDPAGIVGPGGGYAVPDGTRHLLLAGDDTALPAMATILAALPPRVGVTVLAEVTDVGDEQDLGPRSPGVTWLHRARGEDLESAVRATARRLAPGTAAWVAGEGHAVRRTREYLRLHAGLDRARCHAIRYWTSGRTHEDADATFGAARAEAARRGIELRTTQDVHEMSYELMTGGLRLADITGVTRRASPGAGD